MSNVTKNLEQHKETMEKRPPPAVSQESESLTLPPESQLLSFGNRLTYVFAYGKEVGSIHYDKGRGEIFYKGHNIRNIDLEEWQMQMMEKLRKILNSDPQWSEYAPSYGRAVDKVVLEKNRKNR